jgi:hypothetical protein
MRDGRCWPGLGLIVDGRTSTRSGQSSLPIADSLRPTIAPVGTFIPAEASRCRSCLAEAARCRVTV